MKKILILGLLLASHLWGVKEWDYDIISSEKEWCLYAYRTNNDNKLCAAIPTLLNDYKPTKEDKVLKVKVGDVEGEIVGVPHKGIFIRANSQKDFSYVDELRSPSELFLINYSQYSIMVKIDNSGNRNIGTKGGSVLDIYQIFKVDNDLKMFLLYNHVADHYSIKENSFFWCNFENHDSPCPFTKEYLLNKIKEQGGQEFFDDICPAYYDDLNIICDKGIIRERTCQEAKEINPYADGDCKD